MRRFFVFLMIALMIPQIGLAAEGENKGESERETIVISFAGDCTLGMQGKSFGYASGFVQTVKNNGLTWPFSGIFPIFEADDLTIVNLEGTFTESTKAADKAFTFKAPPEFAEILPLGSVEAVTLANNHTMDYGKTGYADTLAALDAQGVAYCEEAIPTVLEVKGARIALMGYCYPFSQLRRDNFYKQIEEFEADKSIDLTIVYFHWGRELSYEPSTDQQRIARLCIDLGADVIMGAHPHVLQRMDMYEGKPICYSLGNFSFGGHASPQDFDTAIVQLTYTIEAESLALSKIEAIPCSVSQNPFGTQQDFRPVPVYGEQAKSVLEKLTDKSVDFPEGFAETGVWEID